MPLRGIDQTSASLGYLERLQQATAFNIANANTDAFKALRVILPSDPAPPEGRLVAPVERIDFSQGTLQRSERRLDLALEGPGFFVVRTAAGERLTRGGSFELDAEGRLVDAHGAPVLGEDGEVIVTGTDLLIQTDGTVLVDGAAAGRLRVEDLPDGATLVREGAGRFVPSSPSCPVEEGTTLVRQGTIEGSNVDPMIALVDLLTIERAYGANLQALRVMDGVLGTTNQAGRV